MEFENPPNPYRIHSNVSERSLDGMKLHSDIPADGRWPLPISAVRDRFAFPRAYDYDVILVPLSATTTKAFRVRYQVGGKPGLSQEATTSMPMSSWLLTMVTWIYFVRTLLTGKLANWSLHCGRLSSRYPQAAIME